MRRDAAQRRGRATRKHSVCRRLSNAYRDLGIRSPWGTMDTRVFERFTERARQVVVLAQDEARALKHNYIGTEHILLGLLREEEGWPRACSSPSTSPSRKCGPRWRASSARATR